MIRCPTCGTLNQDNRKSCSNCKTTLPQTKARCPKCGTPNSVGNLFCDNCNARLVRSEGIIPTDFPEESDTHAEHASVKGISLPTRSTISDSNVSNADKDELPDWLRDLAGDSEEFFETAEEATSFPAEESEDEANASSGYPDWLSGLLDESTDFGATEQRDEPAQETQDELTLESDAPTDWFADDIIHDGKPTPDIGDYNRTDLPDWLPGTEDTGSAYVEEVETPDLPDWLMSSAEAGPVETPMDTELPDWLLGIAGDQEIEARPETLSTETSEETPSWYEAVEDTLREPPETEQAAVQFDSEPLIFSESELPDWLTEAKALTAGTDSTSGAEIQPKTSARPQTEPEPSSDLPDWLSTVDDGEGSDNIELPDWLQGVSQKEPQKQQSEAPFPDLSSQLHPEPLDEWEETTAKAATPVTGKATPSVSLEPELAELPEWLSGLKAGTETQGGAHIFSSDDEEPEVSATEPQERPSWLEDIESPTETKPYEPATPAFIQRDTDEDDRENSILENESAETPDWLHGLDISEPEEPQAQSAVFEGDMPARADLPGWLQELRPQSTPAAGGAADVMNTTEELVNADIPDWLQALRPEPSGSGGAPRRRVTMPTPAEPEGPLEGLPGVLQAFAAIDASKDVKVVAEASIPETVIAQAQLWQRLLEQPRSGERSVSHIKPRSKAAATLVRLLVAAVLILGILGALLLLPEGLRLATISPAQIAPGAPALIEGLDALQPGDRVIVAVEYDMAHAGELSQIAIPVLQHLKTQQAEITFVSTLPEGAALGAALASEAEAGVSTAEAEAETDAPDVEVEAQAESTQLDGGYLAGNASGISALLSQPGAQAVRHILILSSQPERLRWWVEQVQLAYDDAPIPVSLSVGASASVGPLVAPYLRTLQVQGWLVGLPDALAYRELRGVEDTTEASRTLDVLMLAHWAAAGLLVIGLLASLVAGKKGAR